MIYLHTCILLLLPWPAYLTKLLATPLQRLLISLASAASSRVSSAQRPLPTGYGYWLPALKQPDDVLIWPWPGLAK